MWKFGRKWTEGEARKEIFGEDGEGWREMTE